jgi:hypothetical protein
MLKKVFLIKEALQLKPEQESLVRSFSQKIADMGSDAQAIAEALREFAVASEKAEGEDPGEVKA